MTYGRSINIDFKSQNSVEGRGAPVLLRRPAHGRLSSARLALFGISPREAEFSVRGFSATDPARQDRLETVGRSFVAGYNAAIATGQGDAALEQLADFPEALRGFVVEGTAMGLAVLDIVTPWPRRSFTAFVTGPGEPYTYLAYVGAGWALARTSWRLAGRLGRLDPLLRWLMFDGFGFHAGYFQPRRVFDQHRRPGLPQGYAAHAFDQGLGRALWFAMGASSEKVCAAIETFAPERRPDLWAGIGLATTYAGGASAEELTTLIQAAGQSRLDLGQGAAFAAAAHLRAGVLPDHSETACQVLCAADGHTASALTAEVRPNPEADPAGQHYEAWRSAIRAGIAARKGNASC